MSTAAQIAANQANARLSTGPATPAGRAASARNALRHGFRSQTVLLSSDDPAEYQALLDELHAEFRPNDLTGERCLREMADAEWRLRRSRTHQEFMIAAKAKEVAASEPALSPIECEIEAQNQLLTQSAYFRELRAWEAKFERQYDRAAKARANHKRSAYSLAIQQALVAPLPIPLPTRNRTNEANPFPRNASCPCGSREKYKRCCGKSAPPLLNAA